MYTDGSQTLGYHHFLQGPHPPCPSQHCVSCEELCGAGYPPASTARRGCRRDAGAPQVRGGGQRSPQRRPVFAGPGPWSQTCAWELNPALWSRPGQPTGRHCSSVSQHCGCVVSRYNGGPALHSGIPHPLPHLQVKGHGFRRRRTIRYLSMDEEEGCGCSSGSYQVDPDPSDMANGHCGPGAVLFEGGARRDNHQEPERLEVGSKEGSGQSFFSTEVPQKHLHHGRRKGTCNFPSGVTRSDTPTSANICPRQLSEETRQRRRKPTVRDQIRQVVTDLEDVLGGLKQVHVEMKEVVEQIDRLTADMHLEAEAPGVTWGSFNHLHDSAPLGDLRVALIANHKAATGQGPQPNGEDRVILRTNAPSPVHMASVVKTNSFVPPSLNKDASQEKLSVNGHLPHLNPKRAPNHTEPPQTLDPKVIIENNPSNPKTQKPPPYPQNGRCGKGPHPQTRPVKTPAHPVRGRQSTSMV